MMLNISTSNKFGPLWTERIGEPESEYLVDDDKKFKTISYSTQKKDYSRRKFRSNRKKSKVNEVVTSNCLRKFDTKNWFDLLRGNAIENVLEIINVLKTPKKSLKKCRRCNFKKRSCILDPLSCSSIGNNCSKCQKNGHYPQSIYCKLTRKHKKIKAGETSKYLKMRRGHVNKARS